MALSDFGLLPQDHLYAVLWRCLEALQPELDFQRAGVWLGRDATLWRFDFARGETLLSPSIQLEPGGRFAEFALTIIPDLSTDERYAGELGDMRSLLVVPLCMGGSVGTLSLANVQPNAFDEPQIRLTAFVARQIAIAVDEAQNAAEDLQRANDARIEFVSSVAHELRTPMTSIKGYTDMLLTGMTGELTEPQRRFLGIIKVNADRLGLLVGDLLEISRLDAGRIHLNQAAVSLAEVINEAIMGLQSQVIAKGLSFEVAIPDGLPPIWGDLERLVQIMSNLIGNSIKYTPDGGSIRVVAQFLPPRVGEPPYVRLDVLDTGIGIAPEEQPKVFQRFFRGDQELVRQQIGTGLGLAIVKGLVELHGGAVQFESKEGEGSTFSLTLPTAPYNVGHDT